jgi:vancomycin resistance protein VanJ
MPRSRRFLRALSWLHVLVLGVLWLAENRIGERWWLTTLLAYAPQLPAAIPVLLLLPVALLARDRVSVLLNAGGGALALILMGWHAGLPAANPAGRPVLRVMTWNVFSARLGADRVASQILRQSPQILCLQEFGPYELSRLQPLLPGYVFTAAGDTTIAVKGRILERRVLPYPSSIQTSRLLLLTRVSIDGHELTVINTHLATAVHGSNLRQRGVRRHMANTSEARAIQVQSLLATAADISGPLIVCGDFNTPPRGRLYGALTERFTDAFAAVGRGLGHTYSATKPLLRIDYVFTAGGADPVSAASPALAGSDHLPVVAQIALP